MAVQINYKKNLIKKNGINSIFFVDEKFNISGLKKHISSSEYSYVKDFIKIKDLKKKVLKLIIIILLFNCVQIIRLKLYKIF